MHTTPRCSLGSKLLLLGAAFLLIALASIGLTLWVSWHLEGGAAAVNEAGRLRMLSLRLAVSAAAGGEPVSLQRQAEAFDAGLDMLRRGEPARPLFVPWDREALRQFRQIETHWADLRTSWLRTPPATPQALRQADEFVAAIDAFVGTLETSLSRWTTLLHGFQFALMVLAIGGAVALMYAGHLFVLEPLKRLHAGLQRIAQHDFGARVELPAHDEFGELAQGFNRMAEHLGQAYEDLEAKVQEKTLRLEHQRERLAALYEVSSFLSESTTLAQLADGFAAKMRRIARADAIALRWSDAGQQRYIMLASEGLPAPLLEAEQCLRTARCLCGGADAQAPVRVIPIRRAEGASMPHCEQAGYTTLVTVPMRAQHRLVGEIDLFYRCSAAPCEEERSLYETLARHLASALDGLRAAAMEREAAVSDERAFIARELHDSIAQSLAFLKLQVPVLRNAVARGDAAAMARATDDIEAGVRESSGDVRALLLHFRTRAHAEDISVALRTTLQKFEHQTGLQTTLQVTGEGLPLPADVQIQVLHVVQEALSNVRKHAHASHVWLTVKQGREWLFAVRDNGRGFDVEGGAPNATHVGLDIMRERAGRIGARVQIRSQRGEGTELQLTVPASAPPAATPATRPEPLAEAS